MAPFGFMIEYKYVKCNALKSKLMSACKLSHRNIV